MARFDVWGAFLMRKIGHQFVSRTGVPNVQSWFNLALIYIICNSLLMMM